MQPCTRFTQGVVLSAIAAFLLSVDAQPIAAAEGFRSISQYQTLVAISRQMRGAIGRRLQPKIGTLEKCPAAEEWAWCKTDAACLDAVSIKGNKDGMVRGKLCFTGADADEQETKGLHEGLDKVIAQVDGDKGGIANTAHDLFNDPGAMKNAGFQAACNAVPGLMHQSLDAAVARFTVGILIGVGSILFVTGSGAVTAYKKRSEMDRKQVAYGCVLWCAAVIMGLALPFVLTGTPETIKEQAVCSITKTVCEAVKNACDICWANDPCTDVC
jgi:hypothetical protein